MSEPRLEGAPGGPAYDLKEWRRRIPILGTRIPLDSCSQAPQSEPTRAAAQAFLRSWREKGFEREDWLREVDRARADFAALINADPEEVAVCSSVCAATASLASALDYRAPRSRVAVSEAEFPGVAQVWMAQRRLGAEIDWVPLQDGEIALEEYDRVIDERTLLVSACHADYRNGSKQEVAAIAARAHERGALIYVDAYQTVGIHPVDVEELGVDFLASGCHKFLMGAPGIAFLYVRRELLESLEPTVTGWFGRTDPFASQTRELDWSPTASRFEIGAPPALAAFIARAGIGIIRQVGPESIRDWTDELSRRLVEGGERRGLELDGPRDPRVKTPTTAFVCGHFAPQVEAGLREVGVLASARGPTLRLAPHFFNTLEEIDLALDALALITGAEAGRRD